MFQSRPNQSISENLSLLSTSSIDFRPKKLSHLIGTDHFKGGFPGTKSVVRNTHKTGTPMDIDHLYRDLCKFCYINKSQTFFWEAKF